MEQLSTVRGVEEIQKCFPYLTLLIAALEHARVLEANPVVRQAGIVAWHALRGTASSEGDGLALADVHSVRLVWHKRGGLHLELMRGRAGPLLSTQFRVRRLVKKVTAGMPSLPPGAVAKMFVQLHVNASDRRLLHACRNGEYAVESDTLKAKLAKAIGFSEHTAMRKHAVSLRTAERAGYMLVTISLGGVVAVGEVKAPPFLSRSHITLRGVLDMRTAGEALTKALWQQGAARIAAAARLETQDALDRFDSVVTRARQQAQGCTTLEEWSEYAVIVALSKFDHPDAPEKLVLFTQGKLTVAQVGEWLEGYGQLLLGTVPYAFAVTLCGFTSLPPPPPAHRVWKIMPPGVTPLLRSGVGESDVFALCAEREVGRQLAARVEKHLAVWEAVGLPVALLRGLRMCQFVEGSLSYAAAVDVAMSADDVFVLNAPNGTGFMEATFARDMSKVLGVRFVSGAVKRLRKAVASGAQMAVGYFYQKYHQREQDHASAIIIYPQAGLFSIVDPYGPHASCEKMKESGYHVHRLFQDLFDATDDYRLFFQGFDTCCSSIMGESIQDVLEDDDEDAEADSPEDTPRDHEVCRVGFDGLCVPSTALLVWLAGKVRFPFPHVLARELRQYLAKARDYEKSRVAIFSAFTACMLARAYRLSDDMGKAQFAAAYRKVVPDAPEGVDAYFRDVEQHLAGAGLAITEEYLAAARLKGHA